MTAEALIVSRLKSLSALTAIVSTRIYLDKLPQSPVYPCVRVTLISEVGEAHLRGEDALSTSRVQVDAYAKELSGIDPYALAMTVADAIQGDGAGSGLGGFTGTIDTSSVQGIFSIDRRRYYDPEELRVLTISQDYFVTAAL